MTKPNGLFTPKPKVAAPDKAAGPVARKDVRKRWMWVGMGLVGVAVAASTLFSEKPAPLATKKQGNADQFFDVTPKGAEERAWQAKSQKDILGLKEENKDLKTKLDKVLTDMEDERNRPPSGVTPPPVMGEGFAESTPVVAPPMPKLTQPGAGPSVAPALPGLPELPAVSVGAPAAAMPVAGQYLFEPPKDDSAAAKQDLFASKGGEEVAAKTQYKRNKYSGFLPAGAFAPVALLNGLEAGTSSTAQSNPQPVLLAVRDSAVLPGAAKYNISSCFVLSTGYGDLSAERVYLRLAQLSCVDKADKLVLSTPVSGYVVDSDGKVGLRGTVIDRQGAKLAKSLLAGFAQGLAGALGTAQATTTTSAALGTMTSLTGGDALKASGLSGAQTAANQLAQFYLKEAQSMFPVINVDVGRTGTIVFTEGAGLVWGQGDGLYVKEVKPE